MQGAAAADGKSLLLHQIRKSRKLRLFLIFDRDLNPRGSERKKQSGGLFLARSGEPGTVACDGRRTVRMQGTAAADDKSLLLHQIRKSRKCGSFYF